jgi:hypothetical protein
LVPIKKILYLDGSDSEPSGCIGLFDFLSFLISELRFSWVEILAGRYLAVTNTHRPESGAVWEQGRLKRSVTKTLEQMVAKQQTVQREAREATSLAELVDGLDPGQGTMISTTQFKDLYAKIPESVSHALFSPIFMLRITAEKSWDRVYLEKENGKVGIYLLDRSNNVLSYTTANGQQLKAVDFQGLSVIGRLEDHAEFKGRIYSADRFFLALDTLPRESRQAVLQHPNELLTATGTPVRVGISDEVNADWIRIGVEMDTPLGKTIYLMEGKEWAVWQIRSLLEPALPKRIYSNSYQQSRQYRDP